MRTSEAVFSRVYGCEFFYGGEAPAIYGETTKGPSSDNLSCVALSFKNEERESDARRLMRIERAVSVDRKELRLHLQRLHEAGHVNITERSGKGRGGHPVLIYDITENGKTLRSDIGRWIDLGVRMGYYPDTFFYLPSDD